MIFFNSEVKTLCTCIAIYALRQAIARLYGTSAHVNLKAFRFLIIFGPAHTINKYNIVYIKVGFGESTRSHPLVRSSVQMRRNEHTLHYSLSYNETEELFTLNQQRIYNFIILAWRFTGKGQRPEVIIVGVIY